MAKYDVRRIYEWPRGMRFGVIAAIGVITFYLGYFWDTSSLKTQLETSGQQEVDLKQQFSLIANNATEITTSLTTYPQLRLQLMSWQKQLAKHKQIPELLNEMLKLGGNNHLYFNLFNPEDEIQEDLYFKLPIKVIAVGSYQQIANFISQVANLPTIIVVSDFELSNENRNDVSGAKLAAQANAQNLLTAAITFYIYRLAEPHEIKPKTESKKP